MMICYVCVQYIEKQRREREEKAREMQESTMRRKLATREAVARLAELSRKRGIAHCQRHARLRKHGDDKQEAQQGEQDKPEQRWRAMLLDHPNDHDGDGRDRDSRRHYQSSKARCSSAPATARDRKPELDVKARRAHMRQYGDLVRKRRQLIASKMHKDSAAPAAGVDGSKEAVAQDGMHSGDDECAWEVCSEGDADSLQDLHPLAHAYARDDEPTRSKNVLGGKTQATGALSAARPKTAPAQQHEAVRLISPHARAQETTKSQASHVKRHVLQLLGGVHASAVGTTTASSHVCHVSSDVDDMFENDKMRRMQALRDVAMKLTTRVACLSAVPSMPRAHAHQHAWEDPQQPAGSTTSELPSPGIEPRCNTSGSTTGSRLAPATSTDMLMSADHEAQSRDTRGSHDAHARKLQGTGARRISEYDSDEEDGMAEDSPRVKPMRNTGRFEKTVHIQESFEEEFDEEEVEGSDDDGDDDDDDQGVRRSIDGSISASGKGQRDTTTTSSDDEM
jgi:hypothetical protein